MQELHRHIMNDIAPLASATAVHVHRTGSKGRERPS